MIRVQNNRQNDSAFDDCMKCLSDCFIGVRILYNKMIEECNNYNDNDRDKRYYNLYDSLENDVNKNVTILISPKKKQFSPKNIHFRDRIEEKENYNLTKPISIKDTNNTIEMTIPKMINKMERDETDNIDLSVNNIKSVLDLSSTDKKTDQIIDNNDLDDFELL